MISSLRGTLQALGEEAIVVDVGGVGLQVSVSTSVLENAPAVGGQLFLHTRLIVREESLALYGFGSPEEREIFDLLIQVNGVGPRLAMAVLSHLAPEVLRSAVANDQAELLTRVPGVGRKTAEKIVFYLRDRLAAPAFTLPGRAREDSDVLEVLTGLGYSLVEAQAAVQSIPEEAPEEIESRVRLALRYFARP